MGRARIAAAGLGLALGRAALAGAAGAKRRLWDPLILGTKRFQLGA